MNLLKILYQLLPLIEETAFDIMDSESAYKTIMKKTRLKLKALHPDAGGSADEFDRLHKLYEVLLAYKKKNSDYEEETKKTIERLMRNPTLGQLEATTGKDISFEEILSQSIILPAQRKCKIQVDIAELVAHFNRLMYCQVREMRSLLVDMVSIPIDVTAIEPAENGKTTTTNITLPQWAQYNYTGRYEISIALSVKANSILKIQPQGFEQVIVRNVEAAENFKITFEEGTVVLSIIVQIAIED